MRYKIEIDNHVLSYLKKLDKKDKEKIIDKIAIEELELENIESRKRRKLYSSWQ